MSDSQASVCGLPRHQRCGVCTQASFISSTSVHLSLCSLSSSSSSSSQACGFVKSANPGKRGRSFCMKRQHKSKGATALRWDGPRTGTEGLQLTAEPPAALLLLPHFDSPCVGLGGPSRSWPCAAGGSVPPRPTRPPARPVRVTPATTGCSFHSGTTTTCPRAACASTARPRA